MGARDKVRVAGWEVERGVLDQMARELQLYPSQAKRVHYLQERRRYIRGESSPPSMGMPRAPESVSNPTLAKVERIDDLDEEIKDITTWLCTVDLVRDALTDSQQMIVDHLYLLPRSQREYTVVGLANQLSMSESEAYRTKDEALLEFVLVLRGRKVVEEVGGNSGEIREASPAKVG